MLAFLIVSNPSALGIDAICMLLSQCCCVNNILIDGSIAGTVNYLKKLQEITTIYMLQKVTHIFVSKLAGKEKLDERKFFQTAKTMLPVLSLEASFLKKESLCWSVLHPSVPPTFHFPCLYLRLQNTYFYRSQKRGLWSTNELNAQNLFQSTLKVL